MPLSTNKSLRKNAYKKEVGPISSTSIVFLFCKEFFSNVLALFDFGPLLRNGQLVS